MKKGYNERLFNKSSIRGRLHFARYYWLKQKINNYCPQVKTILELGCFDGKTIDFLPDHIAYYEGYDANWEYGLDRALEKYDGMKRYHFSPSSSIETFVPKQNAFDISICMETLEHLQIQDLETYIHRLRNATKEFCFVTVPNEKGLMLLIKYFTKKYVLRNITENYTTKELCHGFFGNTKLIERIEGGHKGFDYTELISLLEKYFFIEEVNGIPINMFPKQLSFTIGVVLKKKQTTD